MLTFDQADRRVLLALTKLKSPEMMPLLEFFKNMAASVDVALRRCKPDDFQKLQGRAQLLEDFLTSVETSADVLEKMR